MKPIISSNIRIRHPDLFSVGNDSIVDDFCYFSTQVKVGQFSHIANNCSVGGGKARKFILGNYCSLSAGVRIWCTSDDFVNDLITLLPEKIEKIKNHLISGDVIFEDYTAVGSNSVVMPGNRIPVGAVIGALSYVPPGYKLKPWTVYAGIPAKPVKARNRKNIEQQIEKMKIFLDSLRKGGTP